MLIVGDGFGIRSKRRLCGEADANKQNSTPKENRDAGQIALPTRPALFASIWSPWTKPPLARPARGSPSLPHIPIRQPVPLGTSLRDALPVIGRGP